MPPKKTAADQAAKKTRKIDWKRYGARSADDGESVTWRPTVEGDSIVGTLAKVDEVTTRFGVRTVIELEDVEAITADGEEVLHDGGTATIWPTQGLLDELGDSMAEAGQTVSIELVELIDTGKGNPFKRYEVEAR